jgi:hypothetical protein
MDFTRSTFYNIIMKIKISVWSLYKIFNYYNFLIDELMMDDGLWSQKKKKMLFPPIPKKILHPPRWYPYPPLNTSMGIGSKILTGPIHVTYVMYVI